MHLHFAAAAALPTTTAMEVDAVDCSVAAAAARSDGPLLFVQLEATLPHGQPAAIGCEVRGYEELCHFMRHTLAAMPDARFFVAAQRP